MPICSSPLNSRNPQIVASYVPERRNDVRIVSLSEICLELSRLSLKGLWHVAKTSRFDVLRLQMESCTQQTVYMAAFCR